MNLHRLHGCAPTPLAHYLKALGILRIVAEQADPEARGWWEAESFVLACCLTKDELLRFFLEKYEPTPLVSPWNRGSGFFANDPVLVPIESSPAPRFGRMREGIRAARERLVELSVVDDAVRVIKAESKKKGLTKTQREALRKSEAYKKRLADAERQFKELKASLIPNLRLSWRGPHREWMDAALVLDGDGEAKFPALLGTGGNDGRLDFTNNFFQRLAEVFNFRDAQGAFLPEAERWMVGALFGEPARTLVGGIAVGQYQPGGAGGANSGPGPDADSRMNPVDFILMLEGSVLFAAGATRRWESVGSGRASAPFAVGAQSAGYCSASPGEESARGEQWLPLWGRPASLSELRRVLAEGRAQLGRRSAREATDLARAVARLGAARGIDSFQRFGYIERNGQSNLAVPLGRFIVPKMGASRLGCLDDLETWLVRLRRQARDRGAPARLVHAERNVADAVFAITQHPDEALRWQTLLLRLAEVEEIQKTGSGYAAGPIPRLRPEWVSAADDGTASIRLAVAFALQAGEFHRKTGVALSGSGVRRHWLSLDGAKYDVSKVGQQERLRVQPDCVLQGRSGIDDAVALVARRQIEAADHDRGALPLVPARGASASLGDLAHLVAGGVDLDRTVALGRALMAVDPFAWARRPRPLRRCPTNDLPDDGWLVVRLATVPYALPNGATIKLDPAVIRRLDAGDASSALELALRRLNAAGIRPGLRVGAVPPATARLWAAALAFPIDQFTTERLLGHLDSSVHKENP